MVHLDRQQVEQVESEEGSAMEVTTLGIDLAKNIFCLHGVDCKGAVVLRKPLNRKQQ
jgi:hypothetical protein